MRSDYRRFWMPAVITLLCGGCAAIEIRTEIVIEAPGERVWHLLIDFERYPEWNPYHVSVEGDPVQGAELQVRIHRPDGKRVEIAPHVLRLEDKRELTWGGGVQGIFWGEHVFLIEELDPQRIRLIHNEDFSGFAVHFADLPPEVLTEGYNRMNRALKALAEQH